MTRITREDVRARAEALGLRTESHGPGDGACRYEFFTKDGRRLRESFSVGAREAWTFLSGYEAGVDSCVRNFATTE